MACVLKDSLNNTLPNERKKVENVFTFSAFFIGKHCFCRHKSKIRHIPFEIYRVFENCPLGEHPNVSVLFLSKRTAEDSDVLLSAVLLCFAIKEQCRDSFVVFSLCPPARCREQRRSRCARQSRRCSVSHSRCSAFFCFARSAHPVFRTGI